MRPHQILVLVACFVASAMHAYPQSYVPYSKDTGFWYVLPKGWEVVEQATIDQFEQQGLADLESPLTKAETEWLNNSKKLLAIQRTGNGDGGAVLSVTIDHIPPTDRITSDEIRSLTAADRVQLMAQLESSGRQLAERFEELYGTRDSKLVSSSINEVGRLSCLTMEFSGTLSTGRNPRQIHYNCPEGSVALLILVTYNRDLHDAVWPDIVDVMRSIEVKH